MSLLPSSLDRSAWLRIASRLSPLRLQHEPAAAATDASYESTAGGATQPDAVALTGQAHAIATLVQRPRSASHLAASRTNQRSCPCFKCSRSQWSAGTRAWHSALNSQQQRDGPRSGGSSGKQGSPPTRDCGLCSRGTSATRTHKYKRRRAQQWKRTGEQTSSNSGNGSHTRSGRILLASRPTSAYISSVTACVAVRQSYE